MSHTPLPESTSAWDQYWHDGRLASCGGAGGANYQSTITEGWQRFFAGMPAGARVLDVCCGNGAVARLAADAARLRGVRVAIDAVDAAAIHADAVDDTGMIRFSPRVAAEDLPFPDASFDVVVGQYAIEYTDLERTLAELSRVSRPSTEVRFVTHAADSVVVQGARLQLADAEKLIATGIFEAAESFAAASGNPGDAGRAHRDFLGALQALQQAKAGALDLPMYQNVGNVIIDAIQQQPRIGTAPVLDKIRETASAIKAHQTRLSAMCRAALDPSAAHALVASAERLWNRNFELGPLVRSDGALFGWVMKTGDRGFSGTP